MLTGVLVTEKYGQIFTGELELCSEDSVNICRELFLCGNIFSIFSSNLIEIEFESKSKNDLI